MNGKKMFSDLEALLKEHGAAIVAAADLSPLPGESRSGFPVGVCIAVALEPGIVAGISSGPTIEYFEEYNRANALLDLLAGECAARLKKEGFKAKTGQATVMELDQETLTTPLPHKTVATRAGVGWIGKCALLVTQSHGSAVRFNTVLTDAPLPAGEPVSESFCGNCSLCVEACPAQAASGLEWHPGLERAAFFDAFACRAEARRLAGEIGLERTICGICIAACPYTQRYLARHRSAN